jgi:hypothetical protein
MHRWPIEILSRNVTRNQLLGQKRFFRNINNYFSSYKASEVFIICNSLIIYDVQATDGFAERRRTLAQNRIRHGEVQLYFGGFLDRGLHNQVRHFNTQTKTKRVGLGMSRKFQTVEISQSIF